MLAYDARRLSCVCVGQQLCAYMYVGRVLPALKADTGSWVCHGRTRHAVAHQTGCTRVRADGWPDEPRSLFVLLYPVRRLGMKT
jgi:hypothetical protein